MATSHAEQAKINMIKQQIRTWEVLDQHVIAAIEALPRDAFVPDYLHNLAYADTELPLGEGESMLNPKVEGRLLQTMRLHPNDRVLEIGTGSGYFTACLAQLSQRVISYELRADFVAAAGERLARFGIANVEVREGNGLVAQIEGGPFDAIVLTGSVPRVQDLDVLKTQVNPGGRLVAVVGRPPVMEAMLFTRVREDQFRSESLFETQIPPLQGLKTVSEFIF